MLYLIVKAVISGVLVTLASEVARRSPAWGALIVSLPLISILAMIWLWRDTGDSERVAALAQGTFWLVAADLAAISADAGAAAPWRRVLDSRSGPVAR